MKIKNILGGFIGFGTFQGLDTTMPNDEAG